MKMRCSTERVNVRDPDKGNDNVGKKLMVKNSKKRGQKVIPNSGVECLEMQVTLSFIRGHNHTQTYQKVNTIFQKRTYRDFKW